MKLLAPKRRWYQFSLKWMLVAVTLLATVLAVVGQFVEKNRADWKRERAAMMDGAVRWNESTYIPNLDLGYTCTIPEWLASWLPLEHQDIYYRVTKLDISAGPAHPDDFERCLSFQDVNTIQLGSPVNDAPRLVSIFKKFPKLSRISLFDELDSNGTSIPTLIKRELPGVQIVPYPRTDG